MSEHSALEPHGELTQMFDDIWTLTGSVLMKPIVRLPRNMVVLREGDELTLINSRDEAQTRLRETIARVYGD